MLDAPFPWLPDAGDGTYRNPVLHADYSDPDVVRRGEDFFLTASSFNCVPGLPILHSRDLVNWRLVSHALRRLPDPRYARVQHGSGVYAPAIRHHDGRFWIFFPTPDEGIYVVTAEDPAGAWSEPRLLLAGRGLIDPCPLWDDDGRAYLIHAFAFSRAGIKDRLRVVAMAPDASRVLSEWRDVIHDPQRHPTVEGPKFLKRDGWYYILAPAGGVPAGWQAVFRSRSVFGPYEDRIVLTQGRTSVNGPHQGALVDTPDGRWWFVHFQDAGVYGRIVHLQPVEWRDGWPWMGAGHDGKAAGEPVKRFAKPVVSADVVRTAPQTSDAFDSPELGLQWQWQANPERGWHSLEARKGWLRLHAQALPGGDLQQAPNLLLQKFPANSFGVETVVDMSGAHPGDQAGLVVMGRQWASLALRRGPRGVRVVFFESGVERWAEDFSDAVARLRVDVESGGRCHFSFGRHGKELVRSRVAFQAVAGVWIGAKVGLHCIATTASASGSGHADFDGVRFGACAPDAERLPGAVLERSAITESGGRRGRAGLTGRGRQGLHDPVDARSVDAAGFHRVRLKQ